MMNEIWRTIILTALILTQTLEVSAKTAIRAHVADDVAFQGWVAAKNFSVLSDQTSDIKKLKEELNRALERAQKRFLTGSLSEARKEYLHITELALDADWSFIQRKAILTAYLRIAQLSDDEATQREFLEAGFSFAPDIAPDVSLFPPPLLAQLEDAKKIAESKAIVLRVRERFAQFQTLTLNGKTYSVATTDLVRIYPGRHRLTLRSDSVISVSEKLSAAQILVFEPAARALVTGECAQPAWQGSTPYPNVVVYFDGDCQYDFANGQWSRLKDVSRKSDDLNWAHLSTPKVDDERNWQEIRKPKTSILKSGWFWVAVAGVVIASAILIQRESEKNRSGEKQIRPSETYQY